MISTTSLTARRRSVLLALALAPCLVGVSPASAVDDPQQGWWSSVAAAGPVPAGLAPDVPEDGLLVQGGAAAPTAYAAVAYTVPSGLTASALVLERAEGTVAAPGTAVKACPLTSPTFTPAQGGSAADAPEYDCGKSVTAVVTGTEYVFEVGPLVDAGVLAVALVPAGPNARVVFAGPDGDALATSGTPSDSVTGTGAQPPAEQQPADGSTSADTAGGGFAEPPAPNAGESFDAGTGSGAVDDTGVAPAPEFAADSAPGAAGLEAEAPAGATVEEPLVEEQPVEQVAPVALRQGGDEDGAPVRALAVLLAGAFAAAAALWAFAGGQAEEPLPVDESEPAAV